MNLLLDLLFPKTCVTCRKFGNYLCTDCINKLWVQDNQICPVCTKGSIHGLTHHKCQSPLSLDGLTSVFKYRSTARGLISKLKYKRVTDLYSTLIEATVSLGDFTAIQNQAWTITSVPLHQTRIKHRGFNQSQLISEHLAGYFGWQTNYNLISRIKNTKPQTTLKGKQRQANIRHAFRSASKSTGLSILLVDDVWTTGATMRECARILKRSGAQKVWGLTIAS